MGKDLGRCLLGAAIRARCRGIGLAAPDRAGHPADLLDMRDLCFAPDAQIAFWREHLAHPALGQCSIALRSSCHARLCLGRSGCRHDGLGGQRRVVVCRIGVCARSKCGHQRPVSLIRTHSDLTHWARKAAASRLAPSEPIAVRPRTREPYLIDLIGARGRIRTHDPQIRRLEVSGTSCNRLTLIEAPKWLI
jgi:hypothetical protein